MKNIFDGVINKLDIINPRLSELEKVHGCLGGSVVEHLPLAQGRSQDLGIESRTGLLTGSLLLPLPVSLPLSLYVSWINKQKSLVKKKKKSLLSSFGIVLTTSGLVLPYLN